MESLENLLYKNSKTESTAKTTPLERSRSTEEVVVVSCTSTADAPILCLTAFYVQSAAVVNLTHHLLHPFAKTTLAQLPNISFTPPVQDLTCVLYPSLTTTLT